MSQQITEALVKQYSANVTIKCQQEGSLLRTLVDEEPITGESAFFDQVGKQKYQVIATRHGDSPQKDTEHSRRMVIPSGIETGDFIDKYDKVMAMANFESPYVKAGAYAIGRGIDDKIILASTGTARTGKEGATSVVLPASQKVAVTYVESGTAANSGMTIGKLRRAKAIMGKGQVPKGLKRYCVCSEQEIQDLLKTTEVTSNDYNVVRALVNGDVDTFLGFKFIQTERLEFDAATYIRKCFCFAEGGIKLGVNADMQTEIAKVAMKRFSWYYYLCLIAGATRMEEVKVVEIDTYDTTGEVVVRE